MRALVRLESSAFCRAMEAVFSIHP
jgi:hypothetical protein